MRRQNKYPAAECLSGVGAGGPKIRQKRFSEKTHTAENSGTVQKNQLTAPNIIHIPCQKHTLP